jgi:hypothetical protein
MSHVQQIGAEAAEVPFSRHRGSPARASLVDVKTMFPVCSFCGRRPVVAWFEGPDFKRFVDAADKVRADEAWLACAPCARLVAIGDREGVARRGMRRVRGQGIDGRPFAYARAAHAPFWTARLRP